MYLRVYLLKVTNFKEFGSKFWPERGENGGQKFENES